jgi:hypothetical protein
MRLESKIFGQSLTVATQRVVAVEYGQRTGFAGSEHFDNEHEYEFN